MGDFAQARIDMPLLLPVHGMGRPVAQIMLFMVELVAMLAMALIAVILITFRVSKSRKTQGSYGQQGETGFRHRRFLYCHHGR